MICECDHAEFIHDRGVCMACWLTKEGIYIICGCIEYTERHENASQGIHADSSDADS